MKSCIKKLVAVLPGVRHRPESRLNVMRRGGEFGSCDLKAFGPTLGIAPLLLRPICLFQRVPPPMDATEAEDARNDDDLTCDAFK